MTIELKKEKELEFPVTPQEFVRLVEVKETSSQPKIILPPLQRDQVWGAKQICELWDSLLRGIPLPSIILSKVGDGANKAKAKNGDFTGTIKPSDYWLLDGQQRANALECGLSPKKEHKKHKKLWLDIGWEEKQSGRKFGFFLCSMAWPWGHNNIFKKPERNKINSARKILNETYHLNGCFDYEIELSKTWPVHAVCPIPFNDFICWVLTERRSESDIESKIHDLLKNNKYDNELCSAVIKKFSSHFYSHALHRLQEKSISAVISQLNDDDLLTTFTRINGNGSPVKQSEMFYSALKKRNPKYNDLIRSAKDKGKAFDYFDILRGVTILSTQKKIDEGQEDRYKFSVGATTLSLDLLRNIKNQKIYPYFETNIKEYLEGNKIGLLLEKTIEVIRYRSNTKDDIGLPVLLLPRLKVRTWLPVLYWIHKHSNDTDIEDENRKYIIKYVLTDHFFCDWNSLEDRLLRGLLDFIEDRESHESFPTVVEIYDFFATKLKVEGKNGKSAWLKSIYMPDNSNQGNSEFLELPLTPDKIQERIKSYCSTNLNPPDEGKLWNTSRSPDLLMWAQRRYLEEWFASSDKDDDSLSQIAMLGELGQPWDKDHIVPTDFFNHPNVKNITPRIIHNALDNFDNGTYGLDASKYHFGDVRGGWRNKIGNYRIWPQGFNRKDQDMGVRDKLEQSEPIEGYRVLSRWWNKNIGKGNLATASAIYDIDLWNRTPRQKSQRNEDSLTAFFQAVSGREERIYKDLFDCIKDGLPPNSQQDQDSEDNIPISQGTD